MAWSTSEIANIASTTVNTVRHYHRVGLLDEPERRFNGYKQYGVRHLVRLLQIRRLVELGLPLGRINEVSADGEGRQDVLRELDVKLVAGIGRLEHARADLAAILRENAPADAPAGFESVSSRLPESDRSLLHISGQLYDEQAMADLRRMAEADETIDHIGAQVRLLPPDADEASRERLVRRIAPIFVQNLTEYPWLRNQSEHMSRSESVVRKTLSEAVAEFYNPAQRDVLERASRAAYDLLEARADGMGDDPSQAPVLAR
ncbi:transcriptional regulator, MerR family protein [Microbacterium faecale]|uniref:Transcriptional regulator, MerR family protein n=1 Tax=Microbacterium faecale TaxID=1804630 RepID=A0A917DL40_9MICO|nr:MerR family transcriptional regulator [Microbacterium faecale]GGD46383.1 transcriptional regulator, MerR family protein [Microbacterium faecale]